MFCPKCGSNQGERKKFCTVCGTNLQIVSQALTGGLPQTQTVYQPPPSLPSYEIERQHQMRKGITMTVLGGGYLFYKLVSFVFMLPFTGWKSPFGFLGFVAFIVFAVGIARIVSSRATNSDSPIAANPDRSFVADKTTNSSLSIAGHTPISNPQPVFSRAANVEHSAQNTSELDRPQRPAISVTEEDTRQLF